MKLTLYWSQFYITFIPFVDPVASFRSLQIDIRQLSIFADRLPEYLSLIVRQVNTMYMLTGILAQY